MKHVNRLILIGTLAFSLPGFAADSNNNGQNINSACKDLVTAMQHQASAVNRLGWKMAEQLIVSAGSKENINYSPLSTSAAMQMAVAGATGSNREEMKSVMGITEEDIKTGYGDLVSTMLSNIPEETDWNTGETEPAYELTLANAVWTNENKVNLQKGYQIFLASTYLANAEAIPFNDQGVSKINEWVDANTNGKIKNLITELDEQDGRLVLTNALRIKAKWNTPFQHVEKKSFLVGNEKVQNVDMMIMPTEGTYTNFVKSADFTGVSLGTEGTDASGQSRIKMYVMMPADGDVNDFISTNDLDARIQEINSTQRNSVAVEMPQFKIESDSMDLKGNLFNLGMHQAFQAQLGLFDNMVEGGKEPLHITDIVQKSFIEVNIHGFEAAAATAVLMGIESASMPAQHQILIDRPFVYVIRDEATGTNLFVGAVNDPTK